MGGEGSQLKSHPLFHGIGLGCRVPDRRPPWRWCEEHVHVDDSSPMPGRWRSDWSPWVRAVMEDFGNNSVKDIAVQCAAQSAKTQTVMNCACWAIAEDPGPAMWVTATKDELRDFVRDRLTPTFQACRPVRERLQEPTLQGFVFEGMALYCGWSGSKARLQSKPIRWLFCDEVRNYPPGRLEMVLKRTRSFWNSRRFLISTPGRKGDAMDTAFRAGDQRLWHFECPACRQSQPLKFEQLKWDTNDATKPEGKWQFDTLAESIRYECSACGHRIKDTPVDRRWMESHGQFVPQNPNAPRSRVSYTWSALLPHWVEWRSVVEEFLAAMDAMRIESDIEPMYTFVTETLGEPWDVERWMVTGDDYLHQRTGDYDFGDPWPLEKTRFMAADRQARGGEHYFWVARAFGAGGSSRLLGYGRCNTTSELEDIRKQLKVPVVNAMIDTGFKASEVYRFCLATGWKAMKGDDAEWFLEKDARTGKTVRRVWRRVLVDPTLGAKKSRVRRHLPLFQWSNPGIKDHLALFTHGVVGQWTLPKKIGRDYVDQMTAEVREEREDSRGRIRVLWVQKRKDNHYLDCELMIDAAAVISGGLKAALNGDE